MRWFVRAPAARLAVLRILVGVFALGSLLLRWGALLDPPGRFHPGGVLWWLDKPLAPSLHMFLFGAAVVFGVLFTLGAFHRWFAPVFATLLLFVLTYAGCWGVRGDASGLLVMHVIVLALSRAADALAIDSRRARVTHPAGIVYGWPIRLMCWLTMLSMFLMGVTVLRAHGVGFASGTTLRGHVAVDALRTLELGGTISPFGSWALARPGVFQALALGTVVLGVGAPIAILQRTVATLWALGAWVLSAALLLTTGIGMGYAAAFVAFAPFFRLDAVLKRFR